jgi:betaine-aldehyde dehydrogenase
MKLKDQVPMTEIIKNYINGALVDGDGSFIDKYYPATGEVIAKVSVASAELLDEAVAKASEAQKLWAARSIQERGQIMIRAAHALREANDELSRLEVQDVGKVYAEAASGDVPSGPDALEFFGAAIMTYTGVQHQWPGAIGYSRRVPLGVCAGLVHGIIRHRLRYGNQPLRWRWEMPLSSNRLR